MTSKKKVFVFPAGTEIGLEICRALKYNKHFELWGGNSNSNNHAPYVYPNYYGKELPLVTDDYFIEEMQEVAQGFDYIYPASDDAVLELARNRAKFDCEIIAPEYGTCEICRSKTTTYRTFADILKVPEIKSTDLNVLDEHDFPMYLKPDRGQGSENNYIANNYTDLHFYTCQYESLLPIEYLPGDEYTIDCFTDRHGELRFVGPRKRSRIKNGISVRSEKVTAPTPIFNDIANIINEVLSLRGAWFFQMKEDAGGLLTLLEIGPRIAGTMGYYRMQGINFAALSLYDWMWQNIEIINNDLDMVSDRALQAKYKINYDYDTVYIDIDDTILIGEKINPMVMAFIFQCRNEGKDIVFSTRGNPRNMIPSVLNDIPRWVTTIYIPSFGKKSDFIRKNKSIFIDDSFAERKEVHDKLGIPVFDVDGVEALIK